jgi:hypothetical protein
MRLLRGELIEEVSRSENVTVSDLSKWRDAFIKAGKDGLKKDPEKAMIGRYEREIGNLHMEIELLKKKKEIMDKYREKR